MHYFIYKLPCLSIQVVKPRFRLSVKVLKSKSRSCPSVRFFVCPGVSVRLFGSFGSLVSLFCNGGYIFVRDGPDIRICNKTDCASNRVSRLIFIIIKIIKYLVIIYLCGFQMCFEKKKSKNTT